MPETMSHRLPETTAGGRRFWALPSTLSGRWSLTAAVLFWVSIAVFYALVFEGVAERGNDTFAEEWPLFISIGSAGLCGIAAAVSGVIAIARKHERSVLVILATLLGLFVSVFAIGELLGPH